jgi:hypothetical protein
MRSGMAIPALSVVAVLTLSVLVAGAQSGPGPGGPAPPRPPAAPVRQVEDVVHGQRIADPYRWLETDSPETQEFQRAQLA